ncbi:MAG: methyltransferase domain-containing protein, partial [Acidimicrobiia bacterium]|nr:methyltransferase domain-containing protein [Acidimicrobiia bacterium]
MSEPDRWFTKSAEVYDHIYEQVVDYDHEADVVDQLVRERLATAKTLNEFACGTGQFLERLANRYDVVGSDVSVEMVAVSNRKIPDVEVREGDMRTIDWGRRFHVALCLFSSIGYVEDTETAVANMARHLVP